MPELSTKPYLIRAIHEWCADCGHTPYLAVVVDERTVVPRAYVKNGEIVLNVSMSATNRLSIGNELIEFQARFGGAAHELSIPVENVTAIYARETGHGMAFDVPRPVAGKEDRRESKRPPKPVAVPPAPRPAPIAAPAADNAADGSPAAALPVPLPVPATPPQATGAEAAVPPIDAPDPTPVPRHDAAEQAPAAGGSASQALGSPEPGSDASASESPGPEDGGGRPRRGGRPKLTRIK